MNLFNIHGRGWHRVPILVMLLVCLISQSHAQTTVSGVVTNQAGEPIPQVSISVKGFQISTQSDDEGRFTILDVKDGLTLIFSHVGYLRREVAISTERDFTVILEEDATSLDEVVVVGYGTQKKSNLTGAVTQIGSENIQNRAVTSASQALQGLVPGLNVTTSNTSGELGGNYNINIRGYTSINGGSPLILVDGIESSIESVNPQDIESVTLLKDQASAAIYGARASYGVLMITTKKGRSGFTAFNYQGNFGSASPLALPNLLNSLQFAEFYNTAAENANLAPIFDQASLDRISAYLEDPINTPVSIPNPSSPNSWGNHNFASANTDWYREMYKGYVFNNQHTLSASGGNERLTFYVSASTLGQEGLLRYGDDYFRRHTFNTKVSARLATWARLDASLRYSHSNLDKPSLNTNELYDEVGRRWPNNFVKDPNGNYGSFSRINYLLHGGRYGLKQNEYISSVSVDIEPLKDWVTTINMNWTNSSMSATDHQARVYEYAVDGTPIEKTNERNTNSFTATREFENYIAPYIHSTYGVQVDNHNVKIMLGAQQELKTYNLLSAKRDQLISDNLPSLTSATGQEYLSENIWEWSTRAVFGRLNYSYDDKYLLEFNARYDGSSKFETGKQWGLFPSISAGYVLSRETFWHERNFGDAIDMLKLRGSYGVLGNQQIASYQYLATIPISNNHTWIMKNGRPLYAGAPALVSPDFTWERVRGLNLGIEAQAFRSRLLLMVDWYKRRIEDMIGPVEAMPAILGATPPLRNNAIMETNGFEISVGWTDHIAEDFRYNIAVNLSDYVGRIVAYQNPTNILTTYYPGQVLGEIWGFETVGIFQTVEEVAASPKQTAITGNVWEPGDIRYADLDGNGVVDFGSNTVDDPGDRRVIGNNTPRYSFSVIGGFSWRSIDFNMVWTGVGKRDLWISNNLQWGFVNSQWVSTGLEQHLDYWSEDNREAFYARPLMNGSTRNQQVQTRYLMDASYLRLRTAQLGYTFPDKWLSKAKISQLRVFVTGENLLTITGMTKIFDPEVVNGGKSYPLQRIVSGGVHLNF